MTRNEYLNLCLANDDYYSLFKWYIATMQLPINNQVDNEYYRVISGYYFVYIDKVSHKLTDVKTDRPIFMAGDIYTVTKKEVGNITTDKIVTTLGRIIVNKILLASSFGDTIEFQDSYISIGNIESRIAKLLQTNVITVSQYKKFVNMAVFLSNFSKIVTVSGTPKTLLPPDGLAKFKKELKQKMIEKYGEDWSSNDIYIVEYEDALREFDSKWLADDPTFNILNSGKVKDNARKRMYLTFGSEKGFDRTDTSDTLVEESLLEGYPKDKKKLANMINNSRAGSYSRGGETQKGGLSAKILLRAMSDITIVDNDCGTKLGKEYIISQANYESFYKRYMLLNNKSLIIEDPKSLIGKKITIRSPMFCKQENGDICKYCTGEISAMYDKGISLMVTDISSIMLKTSMSAVHAKKLSMVRLNIEDVIF